MAASASVFLHAGTLLAFAAWLRHPDVGAIQQPSDVVSVEMVASHTLEVLQPKQASEPAPSPAATAPVEGRLEASDSPATKSEASPETESVEPPPIVDPDSTQEESRATQQGEPAKVDAPPEPVESPAPTEPMPEPPKAKIAEDEPPTKAKEREKIERKAIERAPKGGITSKAKSANGTGSQRASASRGSILTYGALVRARVAANKPSSDCRPGAAVVVGFGVTSSGGLAYVRVVRSSGDPAYRQAATASVRRAAPFPTPPAGATPAQRRFTIPFYCE